MSTTPSQPTKTGLQGFNAPSSIASESSAYQLYYIRFYSSTRPVSPLSYAGEHNRFFELVIFDLKLSSATVHDRALAQSKPPPRFISGVRLAPLVALPEKHTDKPTSQLKRQRKKQRVDVYWLGKINHMDSLVRGSIWWRIGARGLDCWVMTVLLPAYIFHIPVLINMIKVKVFGLFDGHGF
ncbi:hypothetical protein EYC80_004932 [Monilinia laxa]|uniref:Uncharacterized protein n=1 Tax=Monilinia laxa TaxID=61186 RepID=A0A5N6KIU4_MONLA|nr:hypothetical protein EYC80_004932 [Monilinia laxa]